jgi:hypothetical protein
VDEAGALPELIVVSSFPGRPSFRGLGELAPDELEMLWPSRRRATERGALEAIAAGASSPATAPPPLGDGGRFASTRLRLTGAGTSVLRGESDRVELLGLDRWLGGTHLTAQNAWRWDPVERRVLGPAA